MSAVQRFVAWQDRHPSLPSLPEQALRWRAVLMAVMIVALVLMAVTGNPSHGVTFCGGLLLGLFYAEAGHPENLQD